MKLNKILLSAAVATFAVTLLSCDRNGGDIGPYFGIWALDGIDADGNPDPTFVPDHTFFSFHSNVVEVTLTDEYHQYISRFGTWPWGNPPRINPPSNFPGRAQGPTPRRQPYGSISAITTTLQTPAQAGMPPPNGYTSHPRSQTCISTGLHHQGWNSPTPPPQPSTPTASAK